MKLTAKFINYKNSEKTLFNAFLTDGCIIDCKQDKGTTYKMTAQGWKVIELTILS